MKVDITCQKIELNIKTTVAVKGRKDDPDESSVIRKLGYQVEEGRKFCHTTSTYADALSWIASTIQRLKELVPVILLTRCFFKCAACGICIGPDYMETVPYFKGQKVICAWCLSQMQRRGRIQVVGNNLALYPDGELVQEKVKGIAKEAVDGSS